MADEAGGRGFTLYRVVLEIDFAGVLTGSAHLTIHPTSAKLGTVFLHASPLLQINKVTLSSPTPINPLLETPASFTVSNPFQSLPVREPPIDLKSHQEIKRKTWAALGEKDEGELAISVSHGWVRLVESEGDQDGSGGLSFAPIEIQIDYQLAVGGDVLEGIVFRRPGDGGDESQIPHMFLSPTTYDSARIWTPCVDSLWERCTWELVFIVPRYLEGGEPRGDNDAFPVMVVASGELIEQVTHPNDPHKVIFYYMQTTPATVQHITFAAGPFEMIQVPPLPGGGETQKPMLAFCLPGQVDELINTTSFLCRAMSFFTTEFGSFPFSAFKMAFVSNPRAQASTAVTMSIFSSDLLHPSNVIDQAIETRQTLSLALIQQWVGVNIIQRTLSDTWLIVGLAQYLNGLLIRQLLGNNEYRFRLKKDIDRCVHMDRGDQLPLCSPGAIDPPSASAMAFISLKAPLVLHILDRHIAKSGTSLGLSRVIPRIFLASLSDDLTGNLLSTSFFFRQCRKVAGMDLLSFQDQWVYSSGCPHLTIRTNFIRKKFLVEFYVGQTLPALQAIDASDVKNKEKNLAQKRPCTYFEGSLTVRIHEADGAPFEHLVDLKPTNKPHTMFPLPFNTKYKRTRRSGHVAARFSTLQDVLAQADDNDADQLEQLRDIDRAEVFAYPPWDDEEERRKWRVHDWSEEEAGLMLGEGGGYEWIRVDPECEWLASFDIQEKPWFWISQLQGDRDVVAQLQAIQRMTTSPSPVIASELARTVLVENYYYRVRMEAARALVRYNSAEADYMGLFLLLKLYQVLYCFPGEEEDPMMAPTIPRPNDFSNFSDYFLKKSMMTALSELRDPATRLVWRNVRQLLLNALQHNDNSSNEYSDSHYLATVISALGSAFSAGVNMGGHSQLREQDQELDRQLLRDAQDANERAITVDRLVPSYHNVVTQAGLTAVLKSILVGQRAADPSIFLSYTREGNYEPLRLAAFDCLLLSKAPGRSQTLSHYLFDVIRNDYSLTVRRHVARVFSESILMTLAVGEVSVAAPVSGVTEVNPESAEQREKDRERENAKIVKALRKEYMAKPELTGCVQDALMEAFTGGDNEILFALIKAAEVMSSGVPEPKPGAIIKLPTPMSTPVVETPAASISAGPKKIRISLGGSEPRPDVEAARTPAVESPSVAATPIKIVLNNPSASPKKEKKKKNAPKAQAKGMSDSDYKAVTVVLQKVMKDPRSRFFLTPVDPVRDGAPDYLSIVKRPMDLQTAKAKFDNGVYTSRQAFEEDIRLLISNCYLYNPVGSPVRKAAEQFDKFFTSLWTKTENTLKSSMANAAAPPPKPVTNLWRAAESPVAGSSNLMPPPPVPPTGAAAPVKIKLKPSKSVTLEVPSPSSMAPLPIPSSRGGSFSSAEASPARALSPDKSARQKDTSRPDKSSRSDKDKAPKKKRDPKPADLLDDLLGAEVDAMDRESHVEAAFEDLLGSPPPTKKIKLSSKTAERPAATSPRHSSSPERSNRPLSKKPKSKSSASGAPERPKIKIPTSSADAGVKIKVSGESSKPKSTDSGRDARDSPRPRSESSSSSKSVEPHRSEAGASKPKIDAYRPRSTEGTKHKSSDGKPKSFDGKPRSTDGNARAEKPRSTDSSGSRPPIEAYKPRDKSSPKKQFSPAPPAPAPAAIASSSGSVPAMPGLPFKPSWPQPPAELAPTTTNTMPFRQKRAKAMIQVLIKDPNAMYFLRPVDPIRDGCPTYYEEIRNPSDYQSITRKVDQKGYTTMGKLARDIELIFFNCRSFNPPGPITDMAAANEALYWKEWAKAVSHRLAPDEKKAMLALVNRAFKEPLSFIFREAVDPVALGIPQYFEIIPPEDARDLGLIKNRLERGSYSTARQVDEAVELMLENARVFNGEGPIMDIANNFSAWWKAQRSKMDV